MPNPADSPNVWKYSLSGENVKIALAAAAGTTVLVAGLSQIFNPIALGVGLAYGAGKVIYAMASSHIPGLLDRQLEKSVKKGDMTPVPEDEEVVRIATDISNRLGRPAPPKVYFVSPRLVAKMGLPFGLRWLMKNSTLQKMVMARTFAALPGANTIFTTNEALTSTYTGKELAFITAHEMSHLQQDSLSPGIFARSLIKATSRALLWGSVAALGAGIAGIALPVSAVLGGSALAAIGGLAVVKAGAEIITNSGLRTMERRADRNALYVTRDLDSAVSTLEVLHDSSTSEAKETPFWKEAFLSHPSQLRRTGALKSAFAKVSKFPELEAVNDNAQAKNAQARARNM